MKLIIFGASGFVGRHVLAHARTHGYEAYGTCTGIRPDLITFDLAKHHLVDGLPKSLWTGEILAVICACISQIDRVAAEPQFAHLVNVEATLNLVKDLQSRGARIVFLSSGAVFNGQKGGYRETDPTAPVNTYGHQKLAVEKALAVTAPEALILRLDKIIGDQPNENHLFTEWYKCVKAGKTIACIANNFFSPTAVDDVAKGILEALNSKLYGIYHLANPVGISRDALARQFVKMLRHDHAVESHPMTYFSFKEPRPLRTNLNSNRLTQAIGLTYSSPQTLLDNFFRNL